MNFQTICRICIRENSELISIFESYNFSTHNCEIFKVITDCASVQIQKADGFSEQICQGCLDHLSEANSFKKLCEDSDYKFRNDLILKNNIELKDEISIEDTTIQYEDLDYDQYRITKEDSINNVSSSMEYSEPSDLDLECIQNDASDNSDSSYKSKLSRKSLTKKTHLGHNKRICTEQEPPELYKELDDKVERKLIEKTVIKSELTIEDTVINYFDNHVDIKDETVKLMDVELSEVDKESSNDQIRIQNNSHKDQDDGVDEDASNCAIEIVGSKRPCHLKTLQSIENDTSGASTSSYKCEHCNKSVASRSSLVRHMKIHPELQQFKCKICSKVFSVKIFFTEHMRRHTGDLYQCDVCDKKFKYKYKLMMHTKLHTGKKIHKRETAAVYLAEHTLKKTKKRRRCVQCYKRICSDSGRREARAKASNVQTYCVQCKKTYCRRCFEKIHNL